MKREADAMKRRRDLQEKLARQGNDYSIAMQGKGYSIK
jgi:hypothetical protein